jgi:hypothetical protein
VLVEAPALGIESVHHVMHHQDSHAVFPARDGQRDRTYHGGGRQRARGRAQSSRVSAEFGGIGPTRAAFGPVSPDEARWRGGPGAVISLGRERRAVTALSLLARFRRAGSALAETFSFRP